MKPFLDLLLVFISIGIAISCSTTTSAEPAAVRVLIWDEQQPEQKQAYGELFLGETIAAHLRKLPNLTVKVVSLESPEQGLDEATLDKTDVIIWWGHRLHDEVTTEHAERVVRRVLAGDLAFIGLHSTHFAQPFMRLMHERAKVDALQRIPEAERATAKLDLSLPLERKKVTADAILTPRLQSMDGGYQLLPPACVFPSWRADAAPSHVTTSLPEHPIAKGLPATWNVAHTEMYNEPHHVPPPDAVVFEERWDKGEYFRSGCVWNIGKGKVFYFRPGHETFAIFAQPEPLLVLENAIHWMAPSAVSVDSLAGKKVVFLGDSITQSGEYISLATYFLEKQFPEKSFDIYGLGLSSETLSGLSEENHAGGAFPRPCLFERLERLLDKVKPEVVIACYGMNDGIYLPLEAKRFDAFKSGVARLIARTQAAGVDQLFLVTPPIYDFQPQAGEFNYDSVLKEFAAWELRLDIKGVHVIDLHSAMRLARDARSDVFSKDRVHPGGEGHLLMAKTILETFGVQVPEQPLAEIKAEPLYQLIDKRRRLRSGGWMKHIGYTRERTFEPQSLGSTESEAVKLQAQIDALRSN